MVGAVSTAYSISGASNEVSMACPELAGLDETALIISGASAPAGPARFISCSPSTGSMAVVKSTSSPIEAAAYVVVAAGLEAARRGGAEHAGVVLGRHDGVVEIEVTQALDHAFPPMIEVADRVSVAGGTFVVERSRLRAEIPCES